jgi:hypothetical protein
MSFFCFLGKMVVFFWLVSAVLALVAYFNKDKLPMLTPTKWLPKPKERYPDVVKEFGKPFVKNFKPQGLAIWNKSQLSDTPYTQIEIRDEEIPHNCPKPHKDFLLATVPMNITDSATLTRILGLSKSLWYDQLKQELTVRCHHMGANVATALLATQIALDQNNAATKSFDDLLVDYCGLIMTSIANENGEYAANTALLAANLEDPRIKQTALVSSSSAPPVGTPCPELINMSGTQCNTVFLQRTMQPQPPPQPPVEIAY